MKAIDLTTISEISNETIEYVHSVYPIYTTWKNQEVLSALKDHLTVKLNSSKAQVPLDTRFYHRHQLLIINLMKKLVYLEPIQDNLCTNYLVLKLHSHCQILKEIHSLTYLKCLQIWFINQLKIYCTFQMLLQNFPVIYHFLNYL